MGCPPDPLDVEFNQSEQRRTHELGLSQGLRRELTTTVARLEAVLGGSRLSPELAEAVQKTRAAPAALPRALPDERLDSHLVVGDAFESVYRALDAYVQERRSIELTLCEARQVLLKVAQALGRAQDADVMIERGLHLSHRHHDRDTYLRAVAEARRDATSPKRKAQLDAERARVKAFTDEELLADRTLFFEVPGPR